MAGEYTIRTERHDGKARGQGRPWLARVVDAYGRVGAITAYFATERGAAGAGARLAAQLLRRDRRQTGQER